MPSARRRILTVLFLLAAAGAFAYSNAHRAIKGAPVDGSATPAAAPTDTTQEASAPEPATPKTALAEPLTDALPRITKKPFGLKVSPSDSPVSPEKFSGYHVGVDFETTPEEQNIDVSVHAVCDGELLLKKRATGYGGVAVQSCVLDGKDVTVIYGHLKLESVATAVGDVIHAGETLGILGRGYSSETDGERKHLHLGIHLGTAIDIRGYVQTAAALTDWLDARPFLTE